VVLHPEIRGSPIERETVTEEEIETGTETAIDGQIFVAMSVLE
jgi:hypothetical protein